MLTKWYKLQLPRNSSDPWLQNNTVNEYVSCLDQGQCHAGTLAKQFRLIPDLLEVRFTVRFTRHSKGHHPNLWSRPFYDKTIILSLIEINLPYNQNAHTDSKHLQ